MDKNDILDYVTETPGNTNRAVLGSMLDSFAGGGGSDTLVVEMNLETGSLDKTWNEINNAFPNVYVSMTNEDEIGKTQIASVSVIEGEYIVDVLGGQDYTTVFLTDSADGYPSIGGGAAPIVDGGGKDSPGNFS